MRWGQHGWFNWGSSCTYPSLTIEGQLTIVFLQSKQRSRAKRRKSPFATRKTDLDHDLEANKADDDGMYEILKL